MEKGNIYVFSHIPKTAGTSLNYLIRAYFRSSLMAVRHRSSNGDAVYKYSDFKKDKNLFLNLRCISGHSLKPYEFFHEYERKMRWFTFLREPKNRYVSHYIHQRTSGNGLYDLDLHKWALKFNRRNWMVRMIAGEENLQKAIDIIEQKFAFVGFTEFFEESLIIMQHELCWEGFNNFYQAPKMVVRDNQLKQEIFSNKEKYDSLLCSENNLDIQLYEYFLTGLWEEYKAKYASSLKELDQSNSYNKKWGNFMFNLQDKIVYQPGRRVLDFLHR